MTSISGYGDRLIARLGVPRRVQRLGSSPRSRVWWAVLPDGPVIVKGIVGDGDAAERFRREVAALRLAGTARPPVVPRLLAADDEARLMVLEYLDEGRPGPGWQLDYATTLARLHACAWTADGATPVELPRWQGPDDADVADFAELATAWGVTVSDSASDELTALTRRLAERPATALLHGDPCPVGNVLYSSAGLRFIDLEQAGLGDGLVELAYPRIGFPTCYSSPDTPPGPLREAEAAYRETWRAHTGTEADGSVAEACAAWTISGDSLVERAHRGARHLRRLRETDWKWGKATARERLAFRLTVTAAAAAEELPATAALCRELRAAMRDRWPRLRHLTDPELNYR